MTAYRAIVAERKDIATVTVLCEKCSSELSIDAESANIPESCPCCGREYDGEARTALTAIIRFHKSAKSAEERTGKRLFQFTIKQAE